jgi:hypothetical protein
MKIPQQITLITLHFQALTKSTSTLLRNRSRGRWPLTALAQAAVPRFVTPIHYPDGDRTFLLIGRWTWIQQYDRIIGPLFLAENTTTTNISLGNLQLLAHRKLMALNKEKVKFCFNKSLLKPTSITLPNRWIGRRGTKP